MENRKGNNSFSKSKPLRFYFEHNGSTIFYETHFSLPSIISSNKCIDLRVQMEKDGLSLDDITKKLQRCAQSQSVVEKVVINYTGQKYSLVVLLRSLSDTPISEIHRCFNKSCQGSGEHRPIINVLGPNQKDCLALSYKDSYLAYAKPDRFRIPPRPLSG